MGIRLIVAAGALVASLLAQLTIVNGLPLPGGGTPDLVLLCVISVGVVGGSQCGLLAGFGVGLALDVAPPDIGLVGQYALVFCLAGYASGKLRPLASRSVLGTITAAVAIAVAGEALAAGLSLVLGSAAASLAVAATIAAYSSLYDVVAGSLMLVAAIRLAIALGASVGATDDSPAIEVGADAGPAVGWLAGPAVPRIAFGSGGGAGQYRVGQHRTDGVAATTWGPCCRRGSSMGSTLSFVGSGGLAGAGRSAQRRGELRIAFGSGGPAGGGRPVSRSEPKIAFGSGGGVGQYRVGQHRIDGVAAATWGPYCRRGSSKGSTLSFVGSGGLAGAGRSAQRRGELRIAFGSGGSTNAGRSVSPRREPRIAFGSGGLAGAERSARRRREPKIAFASGRSKRRAASTRTVSYR